MNDDHSSVLRAIEDTKQGRPVVIVDDEDRENEGDLMVAAQCITPETLALMINQCRGLICVSLSEHRLAELQLPLQVSQNQTTFHTNFAVSFDHVSAIPHGFTARGRAKTIRAAVDSSASPDDFVRPGFVYPVQALPGGVLQRRGQTEGSLDLARLAGFYPAGVICEIMGPDGIMLRGEALSQFCRDHNFTLVSVEQLVSYRAQHDRSVRRVSQAEIDSLELLPLYGLRLPELIRGEISIFVYADDGGGTEHLAVVFGQPEPGCLARVHSQCLTGDFLGSRRCDCGYQLNESLRIISEQGSGVILYLQQEGRGIGLANKLKAYALQEQGLDTCEANIELGFEPDLRDYGAAAAMLRDLGLSEIDLITNNPRKIKALEASAIRIRNRVELPVHLDEFNRHYLETKKEKLGHMIRI